MQKNSTYSCIYSGYRTLNKAEDKNNNNKGASKL